MQFTEDSFSSGPINFDDTLHEEAVIRWGNIMGAHAKAAALLISLPVAGLLTLGGAGAAYACATGYTQTTINNTPVCVPNSDGGVPGGGTGTVGSGGSTVPGQAQPIAGSTGGNAPIMPPPAPAQVPVAPAPVYNPAPAAPAPVPAHVPNYAPAVQAPAQQVVPGAVPAQGVESNVSAPEAVPAAPVDVPVEAKPVITPSPSASKSAPAIPSAPATVVPSQEEKDPLLDNATRPTGVNYKRTSDNSAAAPVLLAIFAGLLTAGAALAFKFKPEWFKRKGTKP